MKDKILIGLIIILVLALFVETAYLLQIKSERSETPDISTRIYPHKAFKNSEEENSYEFYHDFNIADPFEEIEKIQKRMNKIFEDNSIFKDEGNSSSFRHNYFAPQANLQETKTHYIVKVYLPHMEKEKINVEIKDNSLIISGEHNIIEEKKEIGFYKNSKSFGSFRKAIPLPGDVKVNEVTTEYKDGLLVIRLPKTSFHNLSRKNKGIL
ncbi:MAG: Hsp20/alpha crystallin family protein [Candidatus Melainabacteria bacterium]|nr:Hsp20/alpha crystallin family protein [Candidatus Melainabacteria bacterium]